MTSSESQEYLRLLRSRVCRSYTILARGGCDWVDIYGICHHAESCAELQSQMSSVIGEVHS